MEYWLVFLVIAGLCWGSFLNVLIIRTASQESIIYPFSKCPKCNHSLYWWQNIPIISFLILKGKCYFCNKSISIRYPIIEIIGAAIVVFSFWRYVSVFDALSVVLILSLLLTVSINDVEIKKFSSIQACLIILAGVIFNRYDISNSILGAFTGSGIISALILMGNNLLKKQTFGLGDVFLAGAAGSVVGFDRLFLLLFCALIIHFLWTLPQYILELIREEQAETLKYLIIFGIACLFLYVSKNINMFATNLIIVCFLGILLFSAYKLIVNLSNNIKNSKTQSYCPFAPAIAISCLIFLC